MTTAAKKVPAAPVVRHRVPLAREANYWHRESRALFAEHEKIRRDSGYTSVRISKATLALLREVETLSQGNGLDALLYFDALQRLGRTPARVIADERVKIANARRRS